MSYELIVGTTKGGFRLTSSDRREWQLAEPLFPGWRVTAVDRSEQGEFFVATASPVYGAAIHRSRDLSEFEQVVNGPSYPQGGERKLTQIWKLVCRGQRFYAGVDEAGLFYSDNNGVDWQPLSGLNEHRTRKNWFPGFGGLCAHAVLPQGDGSVFCGISAVGLFRSGATGTGGEREEWSAKNRGVKIIIADKEFDDIGYCVHAVVQDRDDPQRMWRQEHTGMFRSTDGGESWQSIQSGLPSTFGFPLELDQSTKTLYCFPLQSDECRLPVDGKFRVYRSRDGGDHW